MTYGIITHYDVHNHGALLQLYALKQVLETQGVDAVALQFDKNYDFMERGMKSKYDISVKSLGIYLKFLKERGIKSTLFNYKKRKLLNEFKQKTNLVGKYYTEYENLDGVIVGSDEVFALHTGITPAFFGHALPTDKVFSYAACFGPTAIGEIDHLHCRSIIASGLNNMVGISVRDNNSLLTAKQLTYKEVSLVCDPVILYGYDEELQQAQCPCKEPYMVVYAYDKRLNDENEYRNIKKFAKKRGLKIISSGFYHKWVDKNVSCSPTELLSWFKYAKYVVTDTFHGCVLSIIVGREMAVKLRDNANKLFNLMEEYKITERKIDGDWNLERIFNKKVNWNEVHLQIKQRREASLGFLIKMISQ